MRSGFRSSEDSLRTRRGRPNFMKNSPMATYIVGIDCATKDHKVGIAKAIVENGRCTVLDAQPCTAKDTAAATIKHWHNETPLCLLALDAPLGWPMSLGKTLIQHKAGDHISLCSNKLFHRSTDDSIKSRLDKRPLEVGANLIARTAKAALDLIEKIREGTGESIPLAWEMREPRQLSAIEVYPAATRVSLYSKIARLPDKVQDRKQILDAIAQTIDVSAVLADAEKSDHVFDAVLCVVAAFEFINGRCQPPDSHDLDTAKHEGWIWVGPKVQVTHPGGTASTLGR